MFLAISHYHISSPISLVIFSVFDTEICKIFHQKWGSAYSRAEFGGFTFFWDIASLFEGLQILGSQLIAEIGYYK